MTMRSSYSHLQLDLYKANIARIQLQRQMDKVTPTDPKITKQAQYLNIHHNKKDNPKFAVVYFGKITHV